VADFVGVPRTSQWRSGLAKLEFPDRSDRWRDGLDASIIERVTAIQETQLDELGYRP
jgi:hypothetical protein